ncbi:MAG: arsenate reductase ArsC [Deltaproteobacteria bacterium]|nr:arsenate reductase ArsC [Deltaproteobacteria bacterium]
MTALGTRTRVLFVCVHNSARSVMAEYFAREHGGGQVRAESAGFEPRELLPLAQEVMREIGLDLAGHRSRNIHDLARRGARFDYVVLCARETHGFALPVFPGARLLSWDLPEPCSFQGDAEEQLAQTRQVRDQLRDWVTAWLDSLAAGE